jgi:hypothetical protein
VSLYVIVAGLLSLVSIMLMAETSQRDLALDYTGRTPLARGAATPDVEGQAVKGQTR